MSVFGSSLDLDALFFALLVALVLGLQPECLAAGTGQSWACPAPHFVLREREFMGRLPAVAAHRLRPARSLVPRPVRVVLELATFPAGHILTPHLLALDRGLQQLLLLL